MKVGRPRKDAHREDTVLRLLRAAEAEFAAHGFRDARLGDIAEAAGIRRSSLLYHFGSKAKLHAEVVERAFGELAEATASAMSARGGLAENVDGVVESLLAFADDRPGLVTIVLRELVDTTSTGRALVVQQLAALVDRLEAAVLIWAADAPGVDTFPVRAAILQVMSAYLLRVASGDVGTALWGDDDHTRTLARLLLVRET